MHSHHGTPMSLLADVFLLPFSYHWSNLFSVFCCRLQIDLWKTQIGLWIVLQRKGICKEPRFRNKRAFRWHDKACHRDCHAHWQSSLMSALNPQNVCPSCMKRWILAKGYSLWFWTFILLMPSGSEIIMQSNRDFKLKRSTYGRTHGMFFLSSPDGNWPSSKGTQHPLTTSFSYFQNKFFKIYSLSLELVDMFNVSWRG